MQIVHDPNIPTLLTQSRREAQERKNRAYKKELSTLLKRTMPPGISKTWKATAAEQRRRIEAVRRTAKRQTPHRYENSESSFRLHEDKWTAPSILYHDTHITGKSLGYHGAQAERLDYLLTKTVEEISQAIRNNLGKQKLVEPQERKRLYDEATLLQHARRLKIEILT